MLKKYKIENFSEKVIIDGSFLMVFQKVPAKIEIIEPLFPSDDRERKVVKWKEELYLKLEIPQNLQEKINVNFNKFDYLEVTMEYKTEENILVSIDLFDWDEINKHW